MHLGFHRLGRIIGVVDDLDAGRLLEILERRLADIVGPVVDVDDLVLLGAGPAD